MRLLNEILSGIDIRNTKNQHFMHALVFGYKAKYYDKKFNYFLLLYIASIALLSAIFFTEFKYSTAVAYLNNDISVKGFASLNSLSLDIFSTKQPANATNNAKSLVYPLLKQSVRQPQVSSVDFRGQVSLLVEKAKRALEDLRLTRPAKNNLLFFIERIQKIDPDNASASALMQRAREKYVAVFKQALSLNQPTKAKSLIQRAHFLALDPDSISLMLHQLDKYAVSRSNLAIVASMPPDSTLITMRLTKASSERKVIELAIVEMSRKRPNIAIDLLKRYIKRKPHAALVILRLFELYISNSHITEARLLMEQNRLKFPVLGEYFKARLQAEQGEHMAALRTLSQFSAKQIELMDILAYRAALAYKLSAIPLAYTDYAYLVKQQPLNSHYWLGLAMTLEAEKHLSESLKAYLSVQAINDQPQKIKFFVQRKINQLSTFNRVGAKPW